MAPNSLSSSARFVCAASSSRSGRQRLAGRAVLRAGRQTVVVEAEARVRPDRRQVGLGPELKMTFGSCQTMWRPSTLRIAVVLLRAIAASGPWSNCGQPAGCAHVCHPLPGQGSFITS